MTLFFTRFIGVLALDAGTFEAIEADRHSAMQSVIVLVAACFGGGIAAHGLGLVGPAGFLVGVVVTLGGWLVWVTLIAALGTTAFAEPETKSDLPELLRTLGYAAAPGVILVFAAMASAAPMVVAGVSLWMIAAAVLAVRQALDYRTTGRAIAVCVVGWLISFGVVVAALLLTGRPVN
jgi:hypothetical protein